jgi:hypothetical protein
MEHRIARPIALLAALALALTACTSGNVFSLEVGTCFDDPDNFNEVSDVPEVECSEPHDNEVYYLFDLPDGSFPGSAAVDTAADEGCFAAFQPYVGIDYVNSILWYSYLTPTSGSWDQGDREVVCFLWHGELQKLEGSMQGSGV